MIRAALSLLLLASVARGQPNMSEARGPATSAPENGRCGLAGPGWTTSAIQNHIRDVFAEVWNAANLPGVKPPLVFKPYQPEKIAFTTHLNDDDSIPDLQIVVYMTVCDIAHNDDEIAFVLGHELGHVELRHGPKLEELRDKTLIPKCGACDEECCMSKINEAQMPFESAADQKGVEYLSKPGSRFKPEAAVQALRHLKDLRWAQNAEKVNKNHPPLTQRAYELTEWLERAKK